MKGCVAYMHISEIFDPIFDFYRIRKSVKGERKFFFILPVVFGILAFIGFRMQLFSDNIELRDFANELLNQLITVLALFVSFCMGYLSILLTSSSKNIDELKTKDSDVYALDGKKCKMYQVCTNEITYVLVFQLLFLLIVFLEKFIIYILNELWVEALTSLNVALFIHILLVMMCVVKNIYFIFWKSQ